MSDVPESFYGHEPQPQVIYKCAQCGRPLVERYSAPSGGPPIYLHRPHSNDLSEWSKRQQAEPGPNRPTKEVA